MDVVDIVVVVVNVVVVIAVVVVVVVDVVVLVLREVVVVFVVVIVDFAVLVLLVAVLVVAEIIKNHVFRILSFSIQNRFKMIKSYYKEIHLIGNTSGSWTPGHWRNWRDYWCSRSDQSRR